MPASPALKAEMQTCTVCQQPFHDSQLLFAGRGPICLGCDADRAQRQALYRGLWMTVLSGPALAFAASGFGPILLLVHPILGGLALFGFALVVLVNAIRAVLLGVSLVRDYADEVGPLEKGALFLSGAVSVVWGGGLGLAGLFVLAVALFA